MGVSALIANSIAGRLVPVLGARTMFILGWALCIPKHSAVQPRYRGNELLAFYFSWNDFVYCWVGCRLHHSIFCHCLISS